MQKYKFGFWLVFMLVLGLCANLLASDKDIPSQQKLNLQKISRLLPKEARTSLPPNLWVSQKPQEPARAIAGTGAISGHVTQASDGHDPIEGVIVWAQQMDCLSHVYSSTSSSDGFYVIDGLPPGNYKIYTHNDSDFVDIYWDNQPNWETANPVVVISNDTTENKNFSLRVGGKIAGTVTLPLPQFSITIEAIDITSKDIYSEALNFPGISTPYVLKRLPTGTYKVRTFKVFGDYGDVYYNNDSTWASADVVSVTEGSTNSPIDFTLSLGGIIEGNISGAVKGSLKDILVVAYYAPEPEWLWSFTSTDQNGDYTLTGLRSGYWKILARGDATYAFEWYNNRNTWADAESVLVTAPGTISGKDFTLEGGGSISGHVYQGGLPLPDCPVMAYQGSFYQLTYGAKVGTTDSYGSYNITGLRTGDYKVMASTECGALYYDNKLDWSEANSVHVDSLDTTFGINFNFPTAVEDEVDHTTQRPTVFELHQNYPNPFNPETKIEYTMKKVGHVTLYICNVLGEKVRTLLDQDQPAGFYQINWDGKNDNGKFVSSGLYLYKLKVNGFSEAKRMLLLK